MTDAEIEAYSYTAAAGKRPSPDKRHVPHWAWFEIGEDPAEEDDLPTPVFERLQGGLPVMSINRPSALWHDYPTEAAALAAADEAWRRARRDGAIGAKGGGA